MPWIHDDKANKLLCISEKHNRHIEIDLTKPPKNCEQCWRGCYFWRDREGQITVRFDPGRTSP